jgi:sugar phosphate permease
VGHAILALAFATGAIGLCLGGLGLVIVAFSQSRHDPAAVAWIEAGLSVGSALGGLAYGAVTWRASARHRLALLATGLAVILIPAALSPNLLVLASLIGLAGFWSPRPWPPPTSSPTDWHRRRHGIVPGTGSTAATTRGPLLGRCCPGNWSGGFR